MGHVMICKDTSFLCLVWTLIFIRIKYCSLSFFICKAELQTWTKNSERYLERYKILDWFWIALLLDLWLRISVALLCLCYWFSKQIISARGLLVFQAIWLTIMPTQKLSNESFFDKCLSIDLIEHAKRITNNNTHRETRA